MRAVTAWAIGLYVGGKLTGLLRWEVDGRPRDLAIAHTREEARGYLREICWTIPKGAISRPVRVRIEAAK